MISLLYTVLLLLSNDAPNRSQPKKYLTVTTRNGAIRGKLEKSFLQQSPYYAFKGIPFAKPPTGELRFKVKFIFEKKSAKKHEL